MVVVNFSVHEQAIECCVKEVTRASVTVFGQQSRDGLINKIYAVIIILGLVNSKYAELQMVNLWIYKMAIPKIS